MTDAFVAAGRQLGDEGLVDYTTGEVRGGLQLGLRLTDAGVEHLKQGGR